MGVSKELLMRRRNLDTPHIATATGAVASFAGNMAAPLKECKCEFTPVQSGSGDPSPSNVRPISGWTGANIYVSPTTDPQDGSTYPVTFPAEAGTVYGGYVDPVRGVLVASKAYALLNDPNNWRETGSTTVQYRYTTPFTDRKLTGDSFTGLYCSIAPCISGSDLYGRWTGANEYYFGIHDGDSVITLETLQTLSANGSVAICYELATPIEYPLTPPQVIKTLKGVNNVFTDLNGNTTVKFWKH